MRRKKCFGILCILWYNALICRILADPAALYFSQSQGGTPMNPNSCEALPGNYRQTREIDFVNLSRENIIGLLLTLVLLVGPVLLVLPSHPFTLLSSAKNTVFP